MELKRTLVLCGGKFAFPALQSLGIEKYLCGVGIGKGEKEIIAVLEQEISNNGLNFMSFPDKEHLSHLRNWIDEVQPDYIFSISFPFLLTEEVLSYGEDKFINFHPGPLPQYRGPMPLFEVLRYQEKETAVTVHFMNEEFDEGDLILTEKLPIQASDNYGQLAIKLSERTAMVALNLAQMLQFGSTVPRTKQDQSNARYFEKPETSDTFIRWDRMPADQIVAALLSDEEHSNFPGQILHLTSSGSMAISCFDKKVIHVQIIAGDFGILTAEQFYKTRIITNLHTTNN